MKTSTAPRKVEPPRSGGRELRRRYWRTRRWFEELARLARPANRAFRAEALRSHARFVLSRPRPIKGETAARAAAAARWLARAQDATPDDGVSYGYFPCRRPAGWQPSYPETTGYIIPTLLAYAEFARAPEYRERALRMALWEIAVQMPSGAVQGGKLVPPERQTPAAFNTGMVLDGWSAAYRASGDPAIASAARRAADFLIGDLNDEGYFRSNGNWVRAGEVKLYHSLCAWSLYRFGEDSGQETYREAAIRVIEAALRRQAPNGWFADNCLTNPRAPLTHTIGYTLQGVLEVGILAGRDDFVAAAQRGVDPLLERVAASGFLPGRFRADWRPGLLSSCLTGAAQVAVVCYRLSEWTGEGRYRSAADRLTNFLKALQTLDSDDPGINGALPGSFPIFGHYMPGGYPNWATKYLLDALMCRSG